jgi:hypothetical protein
MKTLYYLNKFCIRANTPLLFRYHYEEDEDMYFKKRMRGRGLVVESPMAYTPIKVIAWTDTSVYQQLLFVKYREMK